MKKKHKQIIEWNFLNYQSNLKLGAQQVNEICTSGLAQQYDLVGGGGQSDPTYKNFIKLQEHAKNYLWAKVVENTLARFRFTDSYEIIVERFMKPKNKRLSYLQILQMLHMSENTYERRRSTIYEYAYKVSKEYKLL